VDPVIARYGTTPELLLTNGPVDDRVLTEIADGVFLPLVRAAVGR
jgi:hypothetical protein